jgi:phosphoglycolate phosphatase
MLNAKFPAVRAYVFDLDGTLIDSKMDLVNSVNAMLRATGREELPVETVAGYIGHGAPRLVASALGPEASETARQQALKIFLEHYGEHKLDLTQTYPGVVDALKALAHCPLAVLTNKPTEMSVEILRGLRIAQYFRTIHGGDSFPTKKPDPSGALAILNDFGVAAAESAMIGDSDVDIQTARNAGMLAVAVNYGFGKYDRASNPADLYLDRLDQLRELTTNHQHY